MSITAVNYRPHVWSQGYNPILYSFTSDEFGQSDMKYVIDLYVNGATGYTYRLKQRPNPQGNCIVDIQSIMQAYVSLTDYALEEGWTPRYRNSDEITPTVMLKVGEEYKVNGVETIFNGSGATGAPAYSIGSSENNSEPVRVLPAALPYATAVDIASNTSTNYYFWSDYLMDGNGKFLKRDSNSITVFPYDYHTLSFLNWWDSGNAYEKAVQLIQIKEYDDTNSLLATTNYYNNLTQGGGPQSVDSYVSQTFSQESLLLYFRCGPADLSLNNSTAYYTVQAFSKASATASTLPGQAVSELVTFTLSTECMNLYPRVRLSWLNDLGGRDYSSAFTKFYERTTKSEGETYSPPTINWSGTYPVDLSSAVDKTGNWLRGGAKSFNKVVETTFNIQSDWVTQDQLDFLGGIPESPQVWAYIGEDPTPYTVQVVNVTYTYRLIKQVKLTQAIFELKYTKVQPKQNT